MLNDADDTKPWHDEQTRVYEVHRWSEDAAAEIARLRAALAAAEAERDAAVKRAEAMHRRAQEAEGARVKSDEAMAIMLEKHVKPSLNVTYWYRKWKAAVERAERAEALLGEVAGCFSAAFAEGLLERLEETESREPGSLHDLYHRRLSYAYDAALRPGSDA